MKRLCAALSILLLVGVVVAPTGGATFPGANGSILFSRSEGGDFLAAPDGTRVKRLFTGTDEMFGTFSPDGSKVAFVRMIERGGEYRTHVYVGRSDGTRVRRVSGHMRGSAQPPAWSPDGRWVAYEDLSVTWDEEQADEVYNGAIYVVRPNGQDRARLTGYAVRNGLPSWSPDSEMIVFTRIVDKQSSVFVMNRDGSSKTEIVPAGRSGEAQWSPDGDRILLSRALPGPSPEEGDLGVALDTVTPDGLEMHTLIDGPGFRENPQWSPDGSMIGFVMWGCDAQWEDCAYDLWTMNSDGSEPINHTATTAKMVDYSFAWSPDGRFLLFGMDGDLYRQDITDGTRTRITRTPAIETVLDWQARA